MSLSRAIGWLNLAGGAALLLLLAVAGSRVRLEAPPPTLQLVDVHDRFLGEVGAGDDERLGFWPLPALPERVIAATLAIEDRRFYAHPGVDPIGVVRAVHQNATAGEVVSGASTVPMQVARLQDPGSRTLPRKAIEATTALLLVDVYGKEAVLGQYLTLAPYGNNVHGVRYAARRYFDKPVEDLSWAETALLAGIPQSPGRMNLYTRGGRKRAVARAERILGWLHADGVIDDAELAGARQELAHLHIPERPVRPESALHAVLALEAEWSKPAVRALLEPNPRVRTTLDLDVQRDVTRRVQRHLTGTRPLGGTQAAVVVLDRHTGALVASVGSGGFHDTENAGAIDYTRAARTPGSTLKPLLYASALDGGSLQPGTVLEDLSDGPGGVQNADNRYLGPLLPRRALANSRNVPAVLVAESNGLHRSFDLFGRLGLHDGSVSPEHYGLGLAIGGMPTSPLQLAEAWLALANDGERVQAHTSPRLPVSKGDRAFSAEHSRLVLRWLADPMARMPSFPRGSALELPFPAAVKTGTSPDWRDAWSVGVTEHHVVVVWLGDPDWRPMARLGGQTGAAPLLNRVLRDLHPHDASTNLSEAFPPPQDWTRVTVCGTSGLLVTQACGDRLDEWFPPSAAPVEQDNTWVRAPVDLRTGAPATDATPSGQLGLRTFVDLPPRYAAWAASQGLPRLRPAVPSEPDVSVVHPRDGLTLRRDPTMASHAATLRLQAAVSPHADQVVWWVDGQAVATADDPWTWHWPLEPGEHTIQASLPWRSERSAPVRVVVQ